MALLDELIELERGFWEATGNPDYYRQHMADEGLAVFSMGVMRKDAAIATTSAREMNSWTDIEISEAQTVQLTPDSVALVYTGSAMRDGEPYKAHSSSVYVRKDGSWKMMLHQQSEA